MPKGVYERPGPVGYFAVHKRLRKLRGNAREFTCPCGKQAQEWAYQGSAQERIDDLGHKWSEDLMDYMAMCRECHRNLDARAHCPRGHEYAGGNILMEAGKRRCRACVYARNRAARRRLADQERAA